MYRLRKKFGIMSRNLATVKKIKREYSDFCDPSPMYKEAPWANDFIMAATAGIDTAVARAKANMDTGAVIAALLMIVAAPPLLTGPPVILDEVAKIVFGFSTATTTVACIMIIVLVFQFNIAINKAVRDSDKWRILLARHPMMKMGANDLVINLIWLVTISLLVTFTVCVYGHYGNGALIAMGSSSLVCWLVAFCVGLHFMRAGHVNYYWISHGGAFDDPIDIGIAMAELEKVITASEEQRKSFAGANSIEWW